MSACHVHWEYLIQFTAHKCLIKKNIYNNFNWFIASFVFIMVLNSCTTVKAKTLSICSGKIPIKKKCLQQYKGK